MLKPVDFTTLEEKALQVNHLTVEQLQEAPDTALTWQLFVEWVDQYNKSTGVKTAWNAPIPAGFNIMRYDLPILNRYCKEYGPWDDKRNDQKLVHQIYAYDVLQQMAFWTENNKDVQKLNLSAVLEYFGVSEEVIAGAHDATFDTAATAEILIKLLRVERYLLQKDTETKKRRLEMKGCMANWSFTKE